MISPELRVLGETRREGRGGPFLQRVGRLHVVMAVEQDAERRSRAPPMAHDHRLAAGRLDAGLKADIAQVLGAPFGGSDAGRVIGGIGGDARDAQELEQAIERRLAPCCEMIEHARQLRRAMRAAHSRPHLNGCFATQQIGFAGMANVATMKDRKVRLSDVGRLFAELHVDGLRTLTTAVRLGFEGHALAFIDGGKA